eukprot:CAMPEP_0177672520 /NCGR_PEP_ID=MMETSP0447-20121125/25392_1 /TAXON_ID=0 /ORGANISM="Stygamoeba regulata, Strain BSH-02190019" /LENGTH=216 /DNA_ID=CAMNT_0019180207 /DNA_START=80 /DNA_END=727 /DNA_ORIENTATION=+
MATRRPVPMPKSASLSGGGFRGADGGVARGRGAVRGGGGRGALRRGGISESSQVDASNPTHAISGAVRSCPPPPASVGQLPGASSSSPLVTRTASPPPGHTPGTSAPPSLPSRSPNRSPSNSLSPSPSHSIDASSVALTSGAVRPCPAPPKATLSVTAPASNSPVANRSPISSPQVRPRQTSSDAPTPVAISEASSPSGARETRAPTLPPKPLTTT